MVPTKFVNVVQLIRSVDTWMWPFNPVDNCRLKVSPSGFNDGTGVNAICNVKELLDTTLTLLVVEKLPPKSIAYAFTVLVPVVSCSMVVQFVQPLVVGAKFQAPLFN